MDSRIQKGNDVVDMDQKMFGNISVKVTEKEFNEIQAHYDKEKIKRDSNSNAIFDFTLSNEIKVKGYVNDKKDYSIVFQGKNSLILKEFERWKKSIDVNPGKIEGALKAEIQRIFWSE